MAPELIMDKVRVAVIGLGNWGECHVQAYASLPQAELVAVCDSNAERLRAVAGLYDIVSPYTDCAELWQRDDIDIVDVVTAEDAHLDPVLSALNSGKHVLVEKPAAPRAEEARAMQQTAQENNRFLMPGHILRFEPRYAQVHQAIQQSSIGRVASIYSKRWRDTAHIERWRGSHIAYVSMIHDIDLALWYSGSRVRSVRAHQRDVSGSGSPDLLWAKLQFEDGTLAVLHSTWLVPPATHVPMGDVLEVVGSAGSLIIDVAHNGYELWDNNGRHNSDFFIHQTLASKVRGALRDELGYFCDCVRNGQAPDYIPFADAVHGLEVANAITQSATTEQDVRL